MKILAWGVFTAILCLHVPATQAIASPNPNDLEVQNVLVLLTPRQACHLPLDSPIPRLHVSVADDGIPANVRVIQSSRHRIIDRIAQRFLRATSFAATGQRYELEVHATLRLPEDWSSDDCLYYTANLEPSTPRRGPSSIQLSLQFSNIPTGVDSLLLSSAEDPAAFEPVLLKSINTQSPVMVALPRLPEGTHYLRLTNTRSGETLDEISLELPNPHTGQEHVRSGARL